MTLSATASDSDGTIARVEFYNGTTLLNSDTAAPYTFTWSSVAAGTYTVKAVAYDNSGASASSQRHNDGQSAAANKPPTVTLTAPTNGATFTAPATMTLSANGERRGRHHCAGRVLQRDDVAQHRHRRALHVHLVVGAGGHLHAEGDRLRQQRREHVVGVEYDYREHVVTTPPTGVVFTASPDHATLVTSYELRIFASGADPNTATPIAKSNLGKPTPDANNDHHRRSAGVLQRAGVGNYVAAVAAIGSGGSSISTGSDIHR